jgi:hypothetical protein
MDNVLKVSFCDGPLHVGSPSPMCASIKQLLLLNHKAKIVEILQGCFLHKALPKLLKELNSIKNSGCHGNQKIILLKILKNKNLFVKKPKGLELRHLSRNLF